MINQQTSESIIEFIEKTAKVSFIPRAEITQFLVDCRKYIDNNGLTLNYKVLRFYCDWSLHSTVDRNPFAYFLLEGIAIEFNSIPPPHNYNIAPLMKIPQLIDEIFSFIGKEVIVNFPKKLISVGDKYYEILVISIFQILRYSKIQFPKKDNTKIQTIKTKISNISRNPILVESVYIKDVKDNAIYFEMNLACDAIKTSNIGQLLAVEAIEINIAVNGNRIEYNFKMCPEKFNDV